MLSAEEKQNLLTALAKNATFDSFKSFYKYFGYYCHRNSLVYDRSTSKYLTNVSTKTGVSKNLLNQGYKESLIFDHLDLYCKNARCPAKISIHAAKNKQQLIVTRANFDHNHNLTRCVKKFTENHVEIKVESSTFAMYKAGISHVLMPLQTFHGEDLKNHYNAICDFISNQLRSADAVSDSEDDEDQDAPAVEVPEEIQKGRQDQDVPAVEVPMEEEIRGGQDAPAVEVPEEIERGRQDQDVPAAEVPMEEEIRP